MSPTSETERLKSFVQGRGIDLVGVADLSQLAGMPSGIPYDALGFLQDYRYGIVMGAQWGKLGPHASGSQVSLLLEQAAIEVMAFLEEHGYRGLIVHTEDEFDPVRRIGLLSLKVLAKAAGLGWQGRSLLIVSPEHGPIHRLIAVLTNMPLQADAPVPNQCGDCSVCVDACPRGALVLVPFQDHPARREDVLDIVACDGDNGCPVCLAVCPWTPQAAPLLEAR
ncbi:MAG: 4Fe-4S dicluster domain-containing protein [Chloroflexi bacterium]|nr:4Fe-4S dicluster domain-containing protein [Chloroflexota bacterium]MBU1750349.1 4Fe-4S dicluster domain-containing protein [Chloroflexota bacterium]MBU1878419.1 4Fe-4S dicluster domain-containing protein [Chloroflexota bacterium]